MGQEVKCEARFGDKVSTGKAQFETDEIVFRGEFRLVIPLKSIRSVEAAGGALRVTSSAGTAVFTLGAHAAKWADKIRNPRTLADKLDVKPGVRVSLCGLTDADFRRQLDARAADISEGAATPQSDLIFLAAETAGDLLKLKSLHKAIQRQGAIWIVYPKGRKDFGETMVRQAGLQAGLVDVKVARFSETHTALKFVIPVGKR